MNTHIDRFGRVLVPKSIRDAQGLKAGVRIDAIPTPEGVLLRQADRQPSTKKEKGVLVFTGDILAQATEHVSNSRDERIRKLMGL